jgi:hypothetical protein
LQWNMVGWNTWISAPAFGDSPQVSRDALQHPAGGLHPVVDEGGLGVDDGGSFNAVMGNAPVVRIPGVAAPLVGDPDSAGDDQMLPDPVQDDVLPLRAE